MIYSSCDMEGFFYSNGTSVSGLASENNEVKPQGNHEFGPSKIRKLHCGAVSPRSRKVFALGKPY